MQGFPNKLFPGGHVIGNTGTRDPKYASIYGIKATTVGNSLMRMKIELKVKDVEHLYSIVAKLNGIKGMLEVTRG